MALELNGTTGVSLVQDGVITTADIDDGAVTAGKLFSGFANGITEADQWRMSADLTLSTTANTTITANLERADSDGAGHLGTGMTESSGIFTFPSTGYWLIIFNAQHYKNGQSRNLTSDIKTTTNNSTYDLAARAASNAFSASPNIGFSSNCCSFVFDVTDTATHKVQFCVETANTTSLVQGSSSLNSTHMTFIRLGDT